jgi:glycosyltransferase involved in cell wall biosynthesis
MRCPALSELPLPPPGKTGWPWTTESSQLPDTTPDGYPWPKISIVTPSFNQGQFLEETIRSILLQGYPNMEYVIMDGGSTDESVSIIRKYEKWLAYWVSEPDKGQSYAINKGWQLTTGDAITWLNSDDLLMPEWAKHSILKWVENPGVDLVYGDALIIDSESRILSVFKGTSPILDIVITYWLNPFPQQGLLLRRQLLYQCGLLDEQLHFAMDFDYCVRLLMKGVKVQHISKALAAQRFHPASKTSTLYRVALSDFLRITEKFLKESPASLQNIGEKARRRASWNAAYWAFVVGDRQLARHYAFRYLREVGLLALPKVLSLYILSLSGDFGGKLFRFYQIFRNSFSQSPHRTLMKNSGPCQEVIRSAYE